MGRPLNDKFFGPASDGVEVLGYANFDGSGEACYILRQRSNRKYRVSSSNGSKVRVCKTVNKAQGDLLPGEMCIPVLPEFGGVVEYARVIQSNVVKTFAGNVYGWRGDGNDAQLGTDVDDAPFTPPTADFTFADDELEVEFGGTSDPGDGTIVSYLWDFGGAGVCTDPDSGCQTFVSPVFTYGAAGTYDVTLTVTDSNGLTASVTKEVVVSLG